MSQFVRRQPLAQPSSLADVCQQALAPGLAHWSTVLVEKQLIIADRLWTLMFDVKTDYLQSLSRDVDLPLPASLAQNPDVTGLQIDILDKKAGIAIAASDLGNPRSGVQKQPDERLLPRAVSYSSHDGQALGFREGAGQLLPYAGETDGSMGSAGAGPR